MLVRSTAHCASFTGRPSAAVGYWIATALLQVYQFSNSDLLLLLYSDMRDLQSCRLDLLKSSRRTMLHCSSWSSPGAACSAVHAAETQSYDHRLLNITHDLAVYTDFVSHIIIIARPPNPCTHACSNKLTDLPEDLVQLHGLRVLRLKYNALRRMPAPIVHLSSLQTLEMCGNQLKRLDSGLSRVRGNSE